MRYLLDPSLAVGDWWATGGRVGGG